MKTKFWLPLAIACMMAPALFGCTPPTNDEPVKEDPPVVEDPPAEEPERIEGREVVSDKDVNTFGEEYVRLLGRTFINSKQLVLANAGTGVEVAFFGTELKVMANPSPHPSALIAFIDGSGEGTRIKVQANRNYKLAAELEEGVHTVRIVKATSSQNSQINLSSFSTDGKFLRAEEKSPLAIEFVGDSITVGAGILATPADACADTNTDATKAYAYRTAHALGADYSLVATEGICVKAQTALPFSMLDMYENLSSTHTMKYGFEKKFDVVVVALGTNDGYALSASYSAEQFTADYGELLGLIRSKNESAKIVCIYGLMENDTRIAQGIQTAIAAAGDENISYLPVPTGRNGGQSHPNAEDAAAQAETLTAHLKEVLGI